MSPNRLSVGTSNTDTPNPLSPAIQSGAATTNPTLRQLTRSPIGKKLLTGLTGLGLVLFVGVHLLGNLTLFFSASTYNQIAHVLELFGPLTLAVELLLTAIALVHMAIGIQIYLGKRRARPNAYATYQSAGQPSRQTLSSRTMIVSGLVLGVFLVFHLANFKFGPYYALPNGQRDLSRLVIETFHKPAYVAGYISVVALLGLHLRHGLWSALQSLGVAVRPAAYAASALLAAAIALGFMGLPLSIYFCLLD